MYDYFTNKSKHRLIVKDKHKYIAIYYKNRKSNKTFLKIQLIQLEKANQFYYYQNFHLL